MNTAVDIFKYLIDDTLIGDIVTHTNMRIEAEVIGSVYEGASDEVTRQELFE